MPGADAEDLIDDLAAAMEAAAAEAAADEPQAGSPVSPREEPVPVPSSAEASPKASQSTEPRPAFDAADVLARIRELERQLGV